MKYKIALFPGDGVGPELINEGTKVIEKAAELDKFEVEWMRYPHGAEHYSETKELLAEDVLEEIKNNCHAIYCGTFDNSSVESQIPEKTFQGIIKKYFGHFLSIRPVKLLPSINGPLSGKIHDHINFTIIKEDKEDFYIGLGGRAGDGKNRHHHYTDHGIYNAKFGVDIHAKGSEIAYQIGLLSRKGCERTIRYAFDYASKKKIKNIVSVDRASVIKSHNLWRECVKSVSKEYPEISCDSNLIDSTLMHLIRQPEKYKLIVAPNMFGDMLSDIGTVIQGGISFGCKGNINTKGISMFRPIHGGAPKLKDKGIINPIATIWAGALMLDHLGLEKSSSLIMRSVESVLKEGRIRTMELDGHNSTSEMGDAIVEKFIELHD